MNRRQGHQEENPATVDHGSHETSRTNNGPAKQQHDDEQHDHRQPETHHMILNTWDYLEPESIALPDNPWFEAGARVFAEAVRLAMTVTDTRVLAWAEAAGELCLMLAGLPLTEGLNGRASDHREGDELGDRGHDAGHGADALDTLDAARGFPSWRPPEGLADHHRDIRRKFCRVVELIGETHALDRADGIVSGDPTHRPGSRPSLTALAITDQAEAAIVDLFATLEILAAAQA
ncbi:MAG: hypothetical protein JNM18_15140 [Planctomycetaceae bacterium]|nr:hypothetical protein [Planctomycetaceae bacterium]